MNEHQQRFSEDPTAALLASIAPALVQWSALGDDSNVTRAAARSGVSQPTLSRAMARWEQEAGTALFHRSGREITLTTKGRLLADAARAALDSLGPVLDAVVDRSRPPSLAIGFLPSLGPSIVSDLVASFHAAEPGVLVSHREGAGSALLHELVSDRLDIAVLAPQPDPGFGWLPLGTQNLSLVVPTHHRFASLDSIDLTTASEENYLALDPRYGTRTSADALCAEAGFVPRIFLEADDARTVRDYVGGGMGIAILPSDTSVNPRVVAVTIMSPLASREIGIAWDARQKLTPQATAFRDQAHCLGVRYPGWADLLDHSDDPSMGARQAMSVWSWRKSCLAMKRLRQRRISGGLLPSPVCQSVARVAGSVRLRVAGCAYDSARDLVPAREDVRADLMRARHRISKLLPRHGLIYSGGHAGTDAHYTWLHRQGFGDAALQAAYEAGPEAAG